MNYLKTALLIICVVLANVIPLRAQRDSSYFASYPKLLTGRFFFSQKFTSFKFRNLQVPYSLNYRPNTTINVGVGATYKWATFNLAYGFNFLNPDDEKGETKYVDLQFHGFSKKFTLDVLAQFYSGFYLYPQGSATTSGNYYQRPDLKVNIMGGSYQYVMNYRRFSMKAAYLQTEWQKKSAGSLLVGVEAYGGRIKADSSFTPAVVNREASRLNEKRIDFFEFGPNIGYAYTLVVKEHFFLTGSASMSIGYSISTLTADDDGTNSGALNANFFTRAIGGYNSEKWALSIIYINNGVNLSGNHSSKELTLNTGNVRVCFAHRFVLGSREKKLLEVIK